MRDIRATIRYRGLPARFLDVLVGLQDDSVRILAQDSRRFVREVHTTREMPRTHSICRWVGEREPPAGCRGCSRIPGSGTTRRGSSEITAGIVMAQSSCVLSPRATLGAGARVEPREPSRRAKNRTSALTLARFYR